MPRKQRAGGGGVRREIACLPTNTSKTSFENTKQLLQSSFYMAAEGPELPRRGKLVPLERGIEPVSKAITSTENVEEKRKGSSVLTSP